MGPSFNFVGFCQPSITRIGGLSYPDCLSDSFPINKIRGYPSARASSARHRKSPGSPSCLVRSGTIMALRTVLYMALVFPESTFAVCLFEHYRGRLISLRNSAVFDERIVTTIGQCEKYCLDRNGRCQGANLIPVRTGVYSCELIDDASFSSTNDLQLMRGAICIRKIGK